MYVAVVSLSYLYLQHLERIYWSPFLTVKCVNEVDRRVFIQTVLILADFLLLNNNVVNLISL